MADVDFGLFTADPLYTENGAKFGQSLAAVMFGACMMNQLF